MDILADFARADLRVRHDRYADSSQLPAEALTDSSSTPNEYTVGHLRERANQMVYLAASERVKGVPFVRSG